jgi:hypothetical protein
LVGRPARILISGSTPLHDSLTLRSLPSAANLR